VKIKRKIIKDPRTEDVSDRAPSNDTDYRGKGVIMVNVGREHLDVKPRAGEHEHHIPRSDNVMFDAVDAFCSMVKIGHCNKEIRVYVPCEYLQSFKKIALEMNTVARFDGECVLVTF
jgi:hypothetical protein